MKPLLPPPEGDSYPSGHAMDSYLTAILLAQMVPEKRSALFERAASNAQSRVIAGVHYPSDLEGGKLARRRSPHGCWRTRSYRPICSAPARRYAPTCSYNVGE